MRSAVPQPPRQAGTLVVDDGDAAARVADFLVARKLL
jgi:electron transfer flavoprotein beta subunit